MEAAMRRSAIVLALVALFGLVAPAPATAHNPRFPAQIDLPEGFRPEGITTGQGTTVYVGSLADGDIWRGNVRTGEGGVFIDGIPGSTAVGVEYEHARNRLWVAGGPTGTVTAYDARTGDELARYQAPSVPTLSGTFLNDLVVTRDAVYVTDSVVQRLVVVRLGRSGALPSEAEALPLTGEISFVTGFNANGIVAAHGGRALVLVQSNTGQLFRVDPVTGAAREIDLGGATVVGGDGLERRGDTLYVVQGGSNMVSVVHLGDRLARGRVVATLTDPGLDFPSTATLAAGWLWVVNARFSTPPTPDTNYWITRLSRR